MKKRLTNAEKKTNARIKKEMQKKGILPPDKPRLNRKKFVEEAIKEWNARSSVCWVWEVYITQAAFIMSGAIDKNLRVTQEAVLVYMTRLARRFGNTILLNLRMHLAVDHILER